MANRRSRHARQARRRQTRTYYTTRPVRPVSVTRTRRRGCGGCLGSLALLASFVAVLGIVALALGIGTYVVLAGELSGDLARLDVDGRDSFETNYIYDRNGELLYEFFGEGRRTRIPLSDMPQDLIAATVATEDKTFWTNQGVDAPAILRALLQNAREGEITQGGSTITQQLVRHIAFDYDERVERSYQRKAKEALMAVVFARQHSKEQILELYLNEIYYGNLAYGIEAAAQSYFAKPARELSLAESALLAGLPQSPQEYDPLQDLRAAKARQRDVLDRMVTEGYISESEADAAHAEPLHLLEPQVNLQAPHFVAYVREQLEARLSPRAVARGGLIITTTLDLALNEQVQTIAREHVSAIGAEHSIGNGAVIVLKPGTGEILAMVGSIDYANEAIDGKVNVTVRERQPGSSIKPLNYVSAFESRALTSASIIWDAPTTIGDYQPENYDARFHGPVLPRTALANSYNVPAIKVVKMIGVGALIDTAHRMGISQDSLDQGPDYYGLPLTLGGGEVRLLDLSSAYGTLANNGYYVPSTPFLKIVNTRGEVIYDLQTQDRPQPVVGVDERAAYIVTHILSDAQARCPAFGCPSPLDVSRPAAVKTGTTNDFRDNWTVGYTPYVVVGVWVGNSDNAPMVNSTGITGAAPIWHDVMERIFAEPRWMGLLDTFGRAPQDGFVAPAGIVQAQVCDPQTTHGGKPCGLVTELFIQGTEPKNGLSQNQAVRLPDGRICSLPAGATVPPELLVTVTGLPLPGDSEEAKEVQAWAPANGWPLSAPPVCTPEQLAMAASGALEYVITAPAPGQVVSGTVNVVGTVRWPPEQTGTWAVQVARADGSTIGVSDLRSDPVENGTLTAFDSTVLGEGTYVLRLAVTLADGNAPPPFEVAFVVGSQASPTPVGSPTPEATQPPAPTEPPPPPPTEPPPPPPTEPPPTEPPPTPLPTPAATQPPPGPTQPPPQPTPTVPPPMPTSSASEPY